MNKLVVDLLQQKGLGCWKILKEGVNRKEKCFLSLQTRWSWQNKRACTLFWTCSSSPGHWSYTQEPSSSHAAASTFNVPELLSIFVQNWSLLLLNWSLLLYLSFLSFCTELLSPFLQSFFPLLYWTGLPFCTWASLLLYWAPLSFFNDLVFPFVPELLSPFVPSFSLFLYWTGLFFCTELVSPFVLSFSLLLYWASLLLYWSGLLFFTDLVSYFAPELLSLFVQWLPSLQWGVTFSQVVWLIGCWLVSASHK